MAHSEIRTNETFYAVVYDRGDPSQPGALSRPVDPLSNSVYLASSPLLCWLLRRHFPGRTCLHRDPLMPESPPSDCTIVFKTLKLKPGQKPRLELDQQVSALLAEIERTTPPWLARPLRNEAGASVLVTFSRIEWGELNYSEDWYLSGDTTLGAFVEKFVALVRRGVMDHAPRSYRAKNDMRPADEAASSDDEAVESEEEPQGSKAPQATQAEPGVAVEGPATALVPRAAPATGPAPAPRQFKFRQWKPNARYLRKIGRYQDSFAGR